jgi:acetyl esterase/lipase
VDKRKKIKLKITISVLAIIIVSVLIVAVSGYYVIQQRGNGSQSAFSSETTIQISSQEVKLANIPYCNIGSYQELLNIDLPPSLVNNHNSSQYPLVVYVHGGGWVYGSKDSDWKGIFEPLVQRGFIVASINYFMPPAPNSIPPYAFPLNIEDTACAIRFLRYSASEYHIDPNRIGLLGTSAGGNLVSLEALSASDNGTFDNAGQYLNYSSKVNAVVDCFGPENITAQPFFSEFYSQSLENYGPAHFNLFSDVFGSNITTMIHVSPVNYVTNRAPPFLILQGENDTTVPESQSVSLYNELIVHNDTARLVLVQNAEHDFAQVNPNIPISPSQSEINSDIVSFFLSSL